MSGICAIWSLAADSGSISRRIQTGLDSIAHRGSDGFSIYFEGNAGLGHCLLDTGCNGMFVDEDGYAISFDGRLDNRDLLLAQLASEGFRAPHDIARLHDKALLLTLYRFLGESLPSRLRGDFAIVVWDPDRSSLFVCRDHFGVRPLFWHRDETAIYFASEVRALRSMAGVERFPVREGAAEEFIAGDETGRPREVTAYQGVFRLLPGHLGWIDNRKFETHQYWRLSPGLPVQRADLAPRLRELLQQAVARRIRTDKPVGVFLSGGLDSSSIVGALATGNGPIDVPVFSIVFEEEGGADEAPYIEAMEDLHGFTAQRIDCSGVTSFDDCDEIIAEQDQPVPAPNISTFRHFLNRVARQGSVRIVIDGHGGDEAISYGNGLFAELAEQGSWLRLWNEIGESPEIHDGRGRFFAKLLRERGLRAWRKAVGRLVHRRNSAQDLVRFTSDGQARPFEQALHLHKLTAPGFSDALEVIDHNAAAAGVEMRMPFLDVDLVEFCVTVPAEHKWVRGNPRAILREAMADALPELIATRRDKFDFGTRLQGHAAGRNFDLVHNALYDGSGTIARYTDIQRLRETFESLSKGEAVEGGQFFELWRSVILHRWLSSQTDTAECDGEIPMLEAAE